MTMENKKSGLGAAGTMENYTANIVHNFGTSKHGAENVTQDIFEATKGNKSRTPFMAVINGKAAKERGALDFPPKSEDLKEFPLWGLPRNSKTLLSMSQRVISVPPPSLLLLCLPPQPGLSAKEQKAPSTTIITTHPYGR